MARTSCLTHRSFCQLSWTGSQMPQAHPPPSSCFHHLLGEALSLMAQFSCHLHMPDSWPSRGPVPDLGAENRKDPLRIAPGPCTKPMGVQVLAKGLLGL